MAIEQDWVCIVRLELPKCPLTHGEGACTSTSATECFNTYATCNSICDHQCGGQFISFSSCDLPPHFDFVAFPILEEGSISRSRAKPKVGGSFSNRRSISLTLSDTSSNGVGIDPYFPRGAIPIAAADSPGSLLGRLDRIHKNFKGYKAEFLTGFCSQHISQFRRETMMIDSFNIKPGACDGSGDLRLVDILSVAGDSKCPETNKCQIATLAVGNEVGVVPTLGIELEDTEGDPFLVVGQPLFSQNFDLTDQANKRKFGTTEYIYIGSELIKVSVCVNPSAPQGFNAVLVDRGACGTDIKTHAPGDQIFLATHFENCHIVDVVQRLIQECSSINQFSALCCDEEFSILDTESLEDFRCANPFLFVSFAVLVKPEGLRKLFNELEFIFGFTLSVDAECGTIGIRQACRAPEFSGRILYCDQIEEVTVSRLDEFQQINMGYSPIDCTKPVGEDNRNGYEIFITDDALRQPCARKEARVITERESNTRFINEENLFVLRASMYRALRKHRCALRSIVVRGPIELANGLIDGEGVKVQHESIQNEFGEFDTETLFEVVGVFPSKEYVDICLVESSFDENTEQCLSDETTIVAQGEECDMIDCVGLF